MEEGSLRLDLYLFRSRLFKSRSKASEACRNGRILIQNNAGRASAQISAGQVIRIREKGLYRDIEILELPGKNMSKEAAKKIWKDVTPEEIQNQKALIQQALRIRGPRREGARPTKKERRDIDRLRGRE